MTLPLQWAEPDRGIGVIGLESSECFAGAGIACSAILEASRRLQISEGESSMLGTILLIVLILLLLGALPAWPYSRSWGYGPSGIALVVVIILVVLLATGRI
jgi:hypothetical protein